MHDSELLMSQAYDEGVVTEVIRPAAIIPEESTRAVLVELALRDVRNDGQWWSSPTMWRRFDRPWDEPDAEGSSELIGSLQVTYGMPVKYAITIYRATITPFGAQHGWTVEALCDEALGFGGLTLADCPRADLTPPPKPFRMS